METITYYVFRTSAIVILVCMFLMGTAQEDILSVCFSFSRMLTNSVHISCFFIILAYVWRFLFC